MRPRAAFNPEQSWFRLRESELIRVRIFSAQGSYPRGRITLPSGFYHAEERLALLVTKGYSWHHYIENCGFDEFESPFPAESMFMGSMILCENSDEPSIRFYPEHTPVLLLDPTTVDPADESCQEEILSLVRDTANWPSRPPFRHSQERFFSKEFDLFEKSQLDLENIDKTWSQIQPTDFVLLRGLVALMKSDMLAQHREFGADALMNLYIALECSYQLVLEHLSSAGRINPNASDAAQWMHEIFDQHWNLDAPDRSYKYFQEFYEGRVRMFHPRSRFGDHPFAPNFWDDVIHLRRALPGVFFYLVNGEQSPSFLKSAEEYREKGRVT